MAGFVTPRNLGKTAYNAALALFLGLALVWVVYSVVSGKFSRWQRDSARERADIAEQAAANALANAASANAGAKNAALTRGRTDELVIDVRGLSELAASRMESAIPHEAAPEPVDEDVLAELDAAEDRIAAQAKRLRGRK